jgi:hypothetical protein
MPARAQPIASIDGWRLAECKLVCVDPDRIYETWPHVEHLIKPAMVRSGEMIVFDVLSSLANRRFLLWLIWDETEIVGAVITELSDTITGRICTIVFMGGKDRKRWLHLLQELEDYARKEHCRAMRLYGRRGWKRVLRDYRETRIIMEKVL